MLSERDRVLRAIRDSRFSAGIECPRCRNQRVHLWGRFSGRQRYRCRACRRTFSDLTATPAAYSKRIHLWPQYAACMVHAETLRRSAARVGIHLSTSFRWRHAVLRALKASDSKLLAGWLEIDEIWLPRSEKGKRNLQRVPLVRGARCRDRLLIRSRRVSVAIARDRRGRVLSEMIDATRICAADLRKSVAPHITPGANLLTRWPALSPYGVLAAAVDGKLQSLRQHEPSATPLHHLSNIRDYIVRLLDWLERFRGVATRYLPHYLAWHRFVDRRSYPVSTAALISWPL